MGSYQRIFQALITRKTPQLNYVNVELVAVCVLLITLQLVPVGQQ